MKCSVFAPSHITGFFEIIENENPLKKGSRGAGVVLDKGVITEVKINDSKDDLNIEINGKEDPRNASITEKTVELIRNEFGLEDKRIKIEHTVQLPIGAGFGTSAACALGTSLAIAKILNLPITFNKATSIAHRAEVEMRSGLGDVIGEISGGLVLRLKEGAPGIGKVDNIIIDDSLFVISKTVGEIETSSIIADPVYKEKINQIGRDLLNKLIKHPTPEKFIQLSRRFAENTSLMSDEVLEMVNILDDETLGASMAMLGNTAFAISDDPDTSLDNVIVARIDSNGCRFI